MLRAPAKSVFKAQRSTTGRLQAGHNRQLRKYQPVGQVRFEPKGKRLHGKRNWKLSIEELAALNLRYANLREPP